MEPVRIGVIGCGNISGNYLKNSANFPNIEIIRLADLDVDRAKDKAKEFDIPKAGSVDALLADGDVEAVLNLTIPAAHRDVALTALEAGKHVYNEKPLGCSRQEAAAIMGLAHEKCLLVGAAPDTFLGAGHQTARKLIDAGAIGRPVAGTAFMMGAGHESWHPSPEFYYAPGGGPMFDMGPYYLTALLNMLGPVKRITGSAGIQIPVRTITSQPKAGQAINVETPDHIAGTMEFENGAIFTIVMSFAVKAHQHPRISLFGTEASMDVPDPNGFDGEVKLCTKRGEEWQPQPFEHCEGYGRSVGLADMAAAIRTGRPFRANGANALAVVDLMEGFLDTARTGQAYEPAHPYQRPSMLPTGLELGQTD